MFSKILIANRGEIACRIAATARKMGVKTVAIYTGREQTALHTQLADEAIRVPGDDPIRGYLDGPAIIDIAKRTGAQAIHPGYGFLAENADFAQAVTDADVHFIGPKPAAIRQMGEKILAAGTVAQTSVVVLPNVIVTNIDDSLERSIESMVYPVLIKPSAGGGGKGMHVVNEAKQLTELLQRAKREALNAFGNDALLVEKFLPRARHIEVQLLADRHGNTLHLFERDCSLQRRHQKIIEESPAPELSRQLANRLGSAAVEIAQAIHYEGAGTIEFLVCDDEFYFLEMNTRLQVEHPVTELVTGFDLVEWQIRITAGERLPYRQSELQITGHALEARIYAENVSAGFLPASGTITRLELPLTDRHHRIDSGLSGNDDITPHFDPMLMKVVAHGESREQALKRLCSMLEQIQLDGVRNNIAFLLRVLHDEVVIKGASHTRFVETNILRLTHIDEEKKNSLYALAAYAWRINHGSCAESPWQTTFGWRLNAPNRQAISLSVGDDQTNVWLTCLGDTYLVDVRAQQFVIKGELTSGKLSVEVNGCKCTGFFGTQGDDGFALRVGMNDLFFHIHDADTYDAQQSESSGSLTSPMPGTVVSVLILEGECVEEGDVLMIIEAMKMEHTITAPIAGRVLNLRYQEQDTVEVNVPLMTIEPQSSPDSSA